MPHVTCKHDLNRQFWIDIGDSMKSHGFRLEVNPMYRLMCRSIALSLSVLAFSTPALLANQPVLTAIQLYDGPNGAAYLQLGDVLINGKAYLRDCTQFQTVAVDKSTYGKMQKVTLSAGALLERDREGVFRYSTGAGPSLCLVPDNVKFDHNAYYSLSDMADQAKLTGTPLTPGIAATGPPPLKKGVKLFFVAAPDAELAEFLRGQRAADVSGWLNFLSRYPASPHAGEAKRALGVLYVAAGEASLAGYRGSLATDLPLYNDLKEAKVQGDKAQALQVPLEQSAKLSGEIRRELAAIVVNGRDELNTYNTDLQGRAPGYIHLKNARELAYIISTIDAGFTAGQTLLADALKASNGFDSALRSAESSVTEKQMDNALEVVTPLRAFSSEEPRIVAVVDAVYEYDLQQGKQLAEAGDWKGAVKQFEKAANVKDTPKARDALSGAQKQVVITQNKNSAAKALESSKALEEQHDSIGALDVLYELPSSQKALVADDIGRLKDGYIQSAVRMAKELQKSHDPIRGLGDEVGVEKAYNYLQRAFELSNNDSYSDMLDILGDDLSNYFVGQAKRYLDKPSGSGTELGWAYLEEALLYKPANREAHDAKVAAAPAHAMHSKLSIRVQFRDQTSLRDSTGFLHQLEDAIISGLEMPNVKAVRFGETANGVEPDFQLAGDVLEHQITETPTLDARESKYRIGTHDVPGEEWNKANRAYEAALRAWQADQSTLQGAAAKGNKKEVKELTAKLSEDQKLVLEAQALADSLPRTVTADVIRPYHYTRKTVDIKDTIKLQFRIGETLNSQMGDAVIVQKEDPKQFVLVEDVKADDTEGVKPTGTIPSTMAQQTALENSIRVELIEAVRSKVRDLSRVIYDEAKAKEHDENVDGAAEAYMRFLNCTKEDGSVERQQAIHFLSEQFNMHPDMQLSQ